MPYIKQNKRERLDPIIDVLHQELVNIQLDDEKGNIEGNLNYIITKLFTKVYSSPSYKEINDAIGVLECCKLEYYRKVAAPYETNKEYENGEVYVNPVDRQIAEIESFRQRCTDKE